MKKGILRLCGALLTLILLAGAALCEDAPDAEHAKYEEYGEVLAAVLFDGKAVMRANGFYGYHLDESPYMTVDVVIDANGLVESVSYVDSHAQTPGFPEMLTQPYYDTYAGLDASALPAVDAVSGATATSQAVRYGVQTALYYAEKVYGIAADATDAYIAALQDVYPGQYQPINTDYAADSKMYGTVLFAAEDDHSVAMIIQSSQKLNYKKSSDTGWQNAEPNQYVMIVVVDKESNQVKASSVLTDGTKRPEYFTVPEDKIDAYTRVPIVDETVFDEFTDGLIFELDVELAQDNMGMPIITGTSIIYTGASVGGTFSSQLVRRCFQTAARYYCHYAE